jgi:hypothetical protein
MNSIANVSRKRPRIGDIIEISTPHGLAYAQYTHRHDSPPKFGALIRVFSGTHHVRPSAFADLVHTEPQFVTFFPLGTACYRGIVRIVSNEPVPEKAAAFPTFRSATPDTEGRVHSWWLWDGKKQWRVDLLTTEMRRFPIRGVWNDTLLVERICSGWRAEDDDA